MKKPDIDSRMLENFSWPLLFSLLGLMGAGLVNLYSFTGGRGIVEWNLFSRHCFFVLTGFVVASASLFFDYRILKKWAWPLFILGFALLILVKYKGVVVNGSNRWLPLGPFGRFQPSEPVKVFAVIFLAYLLSIKEYKQGLDFKDLLLPLGLLLVPIYLILKQPDMGTAIHILVTAGPILLYAKLRPRVLITFLLLIVVVPTWLFTFGGLNFLLEHKVIRPYHIQRYEIFKNPERDPNGRGWQITQSKSAIGSGQVTGRGFMEGSQQKYGFLPAAETDFAFAALAEEWGFVGSVMVLLIYLALLWSAFAVVKKSGDKFGALIAVGVVSMLFTQIAINVAMVSGLFPVVGIPLPLISYGGSSTLTTFLGLGLLVNIGMRRYLFQDDPVVQNPKVWEAEPVALSAQTVVAASGVSLLESGRPHDKPWLKHLIKKRNWAHMFGPDRALSSPKKSPFF
ncbi:MAG: rod shape-determining protein RodA [Deltaproteobacteria bacterium]|nr:rod shape-determining protein RodA [Deltaproteobacteria bacterium]